MKLNKWLPSLITLASCALVLSACSQDSGGQKPPPMGPPPSDVHDTPIPPQPTYCPSAEKLRRNKQMYWYAPGGWKSYDASFSKSITSFIGAQWKGIKNGKVLCIYNGSGADFPIILQTNQYLTAPWGRTWGKFEKEGEGTFDAVWVRNCPTQRAEDCPFASSAFVWTGKEEIKNKRPDENIARPLSN